MTTKKSYAARLGVLALVLTLMTTCLLGGTMAKYATEVTGTGSATVAKWSFKANGGAVPFTVNLADTTQTGVAEGKIAPGAKGSFDIEINAAGSEVGIDYTIAFSEVKDMPAGLKFYSDAAMKNEITNLAAYTGLNGSIALNAVGTEVVKTIYWSWPGTNDTDDTAAGIAGAGGSFVITVTGQQKTTA